MAQRVTACLLASSFVLRASKSRLLNSNENFSLFVLLFVILLSVEQNWACKVRYFVIFTFEPLLRDCVLSYSHLFLLLGVKTEYLRAALTYLFFILIVFFLEKVNILFISWMCCAWIY